MPCGNQIKIPEFAGAALIFGAPASAYVDRTEAYELEKRFAKEAAVAQKLFFRGGSLIQYGLRLRPGIDSGKAHTALKALLYSFEPSHESKIATVAQYLHEWCEECEAVVEESIKPSMAKKVVARASKKWRKKR